MASLWDRITGKNLPEGSLVPAEQKIALHVFWGMIEEWERGYETQANILNHFQLDAQQQSEAVAIKQNINAATDKTRFIQVCKAWSYTGENTDAADPTVNKYHDWAQFVTRMNNEVLDQGGTLP